jgi:hypothetical protein
VRAAEFLCSKLGQQSQKPSRQSQNLGSRHRLRVSTTIIIITTTIISLLLMPFPHQPAPTRVQPTALSDAMLAGCVPRLAGLH